MSGPTAAQLLSIPISAELSSSDNDVFVKSNLYWVGNNDCRASALFSFGTRRSSVKNDLKPIICVPLFLKPAIRLTIASQPRDFVIVLLKFVFS